jgi:hypothetical protein
MVVSVGCRMIAARQWTNGSAVNRESSQSIDNYMIAVIVYTVDSAASVRTCLNLFESQC